MNTDITENAEIYETLKNAESESQIVNTYVNEADLRSMGFVLIETKWF